MIRKAFAVLLLFAAPAAAQEGPSRIFEARDLFSLEAASDPQISPDGSRIAYVRRSGDIMTDRMRPSIWLVDTRSGEQAPLAAGPGAHSQPRWSPDGRRLAYISTAEGGTAQLFVRWMASGESVRITGLPDSPTSLAWSPDGRQIAYTMFVPGDGTKLGALPAKPEGAQWAPPLEVHSDIQYRTDEEGYLKPGFSHIFLVSADGGAPRQLSFGSVHDNGPLSWAADGRSIVFSSNRSPNWAREPLDSEVYALDLASGAIRALTDRRGPDSEPVVSPDGRLIAYTGFDDKRLGYQNAALYVMDRNGGSPRLLTGSLDRSVESPVWAADGRSIYVVYDDRGSRKVARVGLDGSVRTVAEGLSGAGLDRPYTGGGFSVARDGAVAAPSGSAQRPPDVALYRSGTRRQLTRLNSDLLDSKRLGEVRHLTATSFDNRQVDAWLTLPPSWTEGRRAPLILEIHGGPFAAYGPHFSTDNQLYAAAGYAVLSVNPRGSTSYGEEFANLIHHAYPGRDYDDLMAAVDSAIAGGFADPDHLYVTGGSGGGVLTAWIVGKTDRFKAAATQKPVIDWASFSLTADNPAFFSRYWFGQYPWENHEAFWARSPLSLVGNVKTPTLVVVGSQDYRTPVSEAEQYYTALQLRGVPTALVKVPGASHGGIASRPSQAGAKAAAILAWFEKYKEGAPAN
ncbi:MAG TPA: S9 family peptidase [Allosphingosinicella sp.]|jgi:dipeptidyl aminopeptidase/acylaminoacyl peptidase|nr:S9 family peptidase [Allosphingosinicella sp.]